MNDAVHIPFLFDQEFDVEDTSSISDDIQQDENRTPEPSQSDDTQAVWQEGHDAGIEIGYERAMTSLQRSTSDTLSLISSQLTNIATSEQSARNISIEQIAKLAKAIAQPLVGRLLAEAPTKPIVELASFCLENLYGDIEVTIRVPVALSNAVSEALGLDTERTQNSPRVQVSADMTLSGTDCKIEWGSGNAVRDESAIWEMLNQTILDRIGSDTTNTNVGNSATSTPKDIECDTPCCDDQNDRPNQLGPDGSTPTQNDTLSNDENTEASVLSQEISAAPALNDPGARNEGNTADSPASNNETLALALGPEIRKANRIATQQEGTDNDRSTFGTNDSVKGNGE